MKRVASFVLATFILSSLISFQPASAHGQNHGPIRVAIIDTGISSTAIAGQNLDMGRNYILPSASTEDTLGHGTAVAALIVGSASAGVTGLCPEAVLVPLVYYSENEDNKTVKGDLSMLAQMIRDAVDVYDCQIINISSGARVDNPALRDAVAWAERQGALVVSSAGNDGDETVYYPGAFPTVLCVGTVNAAGDGAALFSNHHGGVDLLAPGLRAKTASPEGEKVTVSGTSFSTGWVSGAAAAMLTADPTLTPYQLRQLLEGSALDLGAPGYDEDTGWGVLDLPTAMTRLQAQKGAPLPFIDVAPDGFYRDAVGWARDRGITGGTSASTFSPYMTCTRGQTATFLWRAAGSPEPRLTTNPFTDVTSADYYYKAVLWAVEQGITTGTSESTFHPATTCSEAEIITLLWRSLSRPDPGGRSDVAATLGEHYYTDAVAWADTHGLFSATQTKFAPMLNAPRAHIVTYLYYSIIQITE